LGPTAVEHDKSNWTAPVILVTAAHTEESSYLANQSLTKMHKFLGSIIGFRAVYTAIIFSV